MNIADEIAEARKYAVYAGIEANIILVPEDRRHEIETYIVDMPLSWAQYDKNGKIKCFGCDIVYSHDIDKIKAGNIV